MNRRPSETTPSDRAATTDVGTRKPWTAPRLEFVEPKLVKHGEMKQITAGFIGTFVPED
jgi:hypothetical protein